MENIFDKKNLIKICKRIYAKDYVSAYDGNVSLKTNDGNIIVTPSGFCKGDLTEDDLIVTDVNGKKLRGKTNYSSEFKMHLEAYKIRPDIKAIVHAHPPIAIALSVAGIELTDCILPEVVFTIGGIPTAPYATPTTDEVPNAIRDYIKHHDTIILDRHGSITVGKDIFDAYFKLEKLEHSAKILFLAKQLGKVKILNKSEVERLLEVGEKFGLKKPSIICDQYDRCRLNTGKEQDEQDDIINLIANKVIEKIKDSMK